ncbi:MAG: hypothetical protein ACYC6G_20320, partial [Desulfobaccales bacterium]
MGDKTLKIADFLDDSAESEWVEVWLSERNLEKAEAGLEDDTHRVIENQTGNQTVRTQEVLVPGFRVLLALPDNPAQVRIATLAAVFADIPSQAAEYQFHKILHSVAGWEGLKVADLHLFFPGKKLKYDAPEEDPGGREFSYLPENVDFLLRKSTPFYRW